MRVSRSRSSAVSLSAPSNTSIRSVTRQRRAREIWTRRENEIRFAPFSYFWICWKLTPHCSASASCDIPMVRRRMRTAAPSAMSMGSGALVDTSDISESFRCASVPVRPRKSKLRLKSFVAELQSFFSPQATGVQPSGPSSASGRLRSWSPKHRGTAAVRVAIPEGHARHPPASPVRPRSCASGSPGARPEELDRALALAWRRRPVGGGSLAPSRCARPKARWWPTAATGSCSRTPARSTWPTRSGPRRLIPPADSGHR